MLQHKTFKKDDILKDFEANSKSKKEHYIWSYILRPNSKGK
jgi:hypothetical protein